MWLILFFIPFSILYKNTHFYNIPSKLYFFSFSLSSIYLKIENNIKKKVKKNNLFK